MLVIPNVSTPQQDTQVNFHNLQHPWQLAAAFALSNWLKKSTKLSGRQLNFGQKPWNIFLNMKIRVDIWQLITKDGSHRHRFWSLANSQEWHDIGGGPNKVAKVAGKKANSEHGTCVDARKGSWGIGPTPPRGNLPRKYGNVYLRLVVGGSGVPSVKPYCWWAASPEAAWLSANDQIAKLISPTTKMKAQERSRERMKNQQTMCSCSAEKLWSFQNNIAQGDPRGFCTLSEALKDPWVQRSDVSSVQSVRNQQETRPLDPSYDGRMQMAVRSRLCLGKNNLWDASLLLTTEVATFYPHTHMMND